jgi:hypothetical protein
MFHRARWATIRAASVRSGVITATRRSGVSSASRTSSATACASSSGSAQAISRTPDKRRRSGGKSIHEALALGGRNRLEIARLRSGGAAASPERCQERTSSRATPMRWEQQLEVVLRMGDRVFARQMAGRLAPAVRPPRPNRPTPPVPARGRGQAGSPPRAAAR